MINLAVCDDEPFMLETLCLQLSQYMNKRRLPYRIHRFLNGRALLKSPEIFHIIFLDIQMSAPDGMETARLLRQNGYPGLLIFITILKESVFDSFEVQAYDYLVKPLDSLRFCRTLDRAVQSLQKDAGGNLFVKKGNDCQIIPFSQIVYCEALGRKVYVHPKDGETVDYYDRLYHVEAQLDGRFFRCHRSYLVNLDYVRGCQDRRILLSVAADTPGGWIPVSRLRENDLTQALLQHMKERRP